MLRLILLLLLLANGIYFVWSQGHLRAWNFAPAQQTEPQRLAQQLRPENLRILKAGEASRLEAAPPVVMQAVQAAQPAPAVVATVLPTECYQAGVFDDTQARAVRRALESALPAGSWLLESAVEPARWIVYMGKYPNADAVAKKRQELTALNLKLEPLITASLEPGLSLGGYDTQAAANTALANLTKRGVRTAQVVRERTELRGSLLRLAAVDEAMKSKFDELRPALAGKVLRLCK